MDNLAIGVNSIPYLEVPSFSIKDFSYPSVAERGEQCDALKEWVLEAYS